ncbi:MAG: thioredoxin family protein [Negativicutes bacterium]
MKPIVMIILEKCPHCRNARRWMAELKEEYPQYQTLPIEMIDEQLHPEVTKTYGYYYVPTYYVEGVKVHEGVPTKEIVREVFELAMA